MKKEKNFFKALEIVYYQLTEPWKKEVKVDL